MAAQARNVNIERTGMPYTVRIVDFFVDTYGCFTGYFWVFLNFVTYLVPLDPFLVLPRSVHRAAKCPHLNCRAMQGGQFQRGEHTGMSVTPATRVIRGISMPKIQKLC